MLDIGHCHSLWRLPAALLSLRQLRRLVLATKAIGQGVVERLELRSSNPVDVEFDSEEDPDADWDSSDISGSEDAAGSEGGGSGDVGGPAQDSNLGGVPDGLHALGLGAGHPQDA